MLLPEHPLLSNTSDTAIFSFLYISNFIDLENQFMAWSWSLSIEEQFYFLLPLTTLFLLKKSINPIKAFIFLHFLLISYTAIKFIALSDSLLSPTHGMDFHGYYNRFYTDPAIRFTSILPGVIVAAVHRSPDAMSKWLDFSKKHIGTIQLIALSVMLIALFNRHYVTYQTIESTAIIVFKNTVFASAAGVLLLTGLHPTAFRMTLCSPYWVPLARLSYSCYLIHPMIIIGCLEIHKQGSGQWESVSPILIFSAIMSSVILGSVIFYWLLEKPCLHLRDKLLQRLQGHRI